MYGNLQIANQIRRVSMFSDRGGEGGGGKIPRARNVHSDKHGPELDKNLCEDICEWQGIMKTIAVTRFMSLTNVR
jgi:hypothetical protein